MSKDLKERSIKIQGREYVLVKDRIIFFNEQFPNGCIQAAIDRETSSTEYIAFEARVIPDIDKPDRFFLGHAGEFVGRGLVNKTAALENAETSAVGRALGMMGIGVIDSVASVDEMAKATGITPQQFQEISDLCSDPDAPKSVVEYFLKETKQGLSRDKAEEAIKRGWAAVEKAKKQRAGAKPDEDKPADAKPIPKKRLADITDEDIPF